MKFIYTTGRISEDEIMDYGSVLSTKRAEGDFKIEVSVIVKDKTLCAVCIGNTVSKAKGIQCFARYDEEDYIDKPFEFTTGKWHSSYFNFGDDFSTDYEEFFKLVDQLGCPESTKKLFLDLVDCMKSKEKIGLYNAKRGDKAYDETDDYIAWSELKQEDMYDDITPKTLEEKREYYNNNKIFEEDLWDRRVKCRHCGKTFKFTDFKVIREKKWYCEDEFEYIVCKHYPECDGSLIDMISVGKVKPK